MLRCCCTSFVWTAERRARRLRETKSPGEHRSAAVFNSRHTQDRNDAAQEKVPREEYPQQSVPVLFLSKSGLLALSVLNTALLKTLHQYHGKKIKRGTGQRPALLGVSEYIFSCAECCEEPCSKPRATAAVLVSGKSDAEYSTCTGRKYFEYVSCALSSTAVRSTPYILLYEVILAQRAKPCFVQVRVTTEVLEFEVGGQS